MDLHKYGMLWAGIPLMGKIGSKRIGFGGSDCPLIH